MKRIRGGSGLGDSLYVRPIADHFLRTGHRVVVKSDYPDVFLGSTAIVEPFSRSDCNVVAHYTLGKSNPNTTQWQDVCTQAGVKNVDLHFDWEIRNQELVDRVLKQAAGRPVVLVNGGRPPMGRSDGYAREMLPEKAAFDAVLASLADCFLVEIGKGKEIYPLKTDLDLSEETSAADVLDLAKSAHGLVGQCSFMIPLAECFDKPLLVVWAERGLASDTEYIRQCTPLKLLSKLSSLFVMDDWSAEGIREITRLFITTEHSCLI